MDNDGGDMETTTPAPQPAVRSLGETVDVDPYELYDRIRAQGQLVWDDLLGAWVTASYDVARQIFVDDKVKRYAVDLVSATRDPKAANLAALAPLIDNGASVRASIALIKVAKKIARPATNSVWRSPASVDSFDFSRK